MGSLLYIPTLNFRPCPFQRFLQPTNFSLEAVLGASTLKLLAIMAPITATANLATAALDPASTLSQPGGFGGDEFSNNLFSDLAPLLALFGEQVSIYLWLS